MSEDDLDGRRLDQELQLLRWRAERLTALGYDAARALVLACSAVDLHELERLISLGCPLGTAVRIVA